MRGGLSYSGVGLHQKRHKFEPHETQELIRLRNREEEIDRKRETFQKHIDELENQGTPLTVANLVVKTGLSRRSVYLRLQLCGKKYYRDKVISMITDQMKFARMRMSRQQLILMAEDKLRPEDIWFSDECKVELTGSQVRFFSFFVRFLFESFSA